MSRLCLFFRKEPERDRWIPGDRFVRPVARRILRGRPRPGGLEKVMINLQRGLDKLGVAYLYNPSFRALRPDDRVAILGLGRHCLDGYNCANPIVAGIGLMTHPSQWPTLTKDYPVVKYLQHSAWCDAVYRHWFGDLCEIWPVGIDTDAWTPAAPEEKEVDFLIYEKIHWDYAARTSDLIDPIRRKLQELGRTFETLRYGSYDPVDYRSALRRSRAMIFLSAHESQGIAYQEAMSTGVPILAWDPGTVQDPERFSWNQPVIPCTSVPYFDQRCGRTFRDASEFTNVLPEFLDNLAAGRFNPRDYVVENLTLEKCARHFVQIVEAAWAENS